MGCDFFYEGTLPEIELQEKVIAFVTSFFEGDMLTIAPKPDLKYKTWIQRPSSGLPPQNEKKELYPFNFYGVIPLYPGTLIKHDQFVFNRNEGGKLGAFLALPQTFGRAPEEGVQEDIDVCFSEGGYTRGGASLSFGLLLQIIRLRWWPGLELCDDYNICKDTARMIWDYGFAAQLKDERLDWPACWKLFFGEYERRHPPYEPSPGLPPVHNLIKQVDLSVKDIATTDIELSVRTSSCLKNAKIETLGQLITFSGAELKKLKNFGSKSLAEIKEVLEEYGLCLMEGNTAVSSEDVEKKLKALPKPKRIISQKNDKETYIKKPCKTDVKLFPVADIAAELFGVVKDYNKPNETED